MPGDLRTHPYPAPGVPIIPATYRAGKFGYVVALVVIPAYFLLRVGPSKVVASAWLAQILAGYAAVALMVVIYLHAIHLEIRPDGISYGNLFHGARAVAFSEISMAVLYTTSNPRTSSWGASSRAGNLVITPKPETGKSALKIPINYFPREAKAQLMYLLKPEEWDED